MTGRSLRVLDGAVAVFCAVAGVQPQSETVWRQADKYDVPRLAFINKMDRTGADFFNAIETMKDRLGAKAVPIQFPIGAEDKFRACVDLITRKTISWDSDEIDTKMIELEMPAEAVDEVERLRGELVEAIVEHDEALMEKYLEGEEITDDELRAGLRMCTLEGHIVPVLAGTALKNKGVQLMLDAVVNYLPSPLDVAGIEGIEPRTDNKLVRQPNDEEPFSALAFKIMTDPHVGKLTFIRVYSGTLPAGTQVYNSRTTKKERLGRLLEMHANSRTDLEEIRAGDIGAVIGCKDTRTGDTLCDLKDPIELMNVDFPDPVVQVAIEPKSKADQDRLSEAMVKLSEEDPTFHVHTDDETGQTVIAGMVNFTWTFS